MAIGHVIGNSHRAANVVRSVREMARESAPTIATFDINEVIRELLDLLSLDFNRHSIVVETELAEDLEAIRGDCDQLDRVVANLVGNAIDAMSAVHDRPRKLRITSERDESGGVLISVEDSGEGLDPAHINRIFEPFFTTKQGGMGLGLQICRSIIEAHDGRLWVTPNPPYGSVFRLLVPHRLR